MLVVLTAEIEEGRIPIESVALDNIEETPVTNHKALSQAPSGDDLALAGPNHLDIEYDRQRETHQVGHNTTMIVLGDSFFLALPADLYLSLAAPVTVALSTGKKTRDRRGPRTAGAIGSYPKPCFALGGG